MNAQLKAVFSRTAYPLALAALVAAFAGGFFLRGMFSDHTAHPAPDAASAPEAAAAADTVWTCSMHPQIRQPNPGKCPICAMDLIPAGNDGGAGDGPPRRMGFSPAAAALMRVATVPAYRARADGQRSLLGRIAADETRLATISAWMPGRIEKMHVAFTGETVAAGQPLVTIFSPDLLAAASELKMAEAALARADAASPLRGAMADNAAAARAKLRRLGIDAARIDAMAKGGQADRVVITAPASGTVIERMGQEGMYVETGEALYRLTDLSRVWVNLEAYESDLSALAIGAEVTLTAEALPGAAFTGKVEFIDPVLDAMSRIARVRVSLPNPEGLLRPGMFVRAQTANAPPSDAALMIPATAPLITGKRALVYVMLEGAERPTFESREVVLGARAGDAYPVLSGLNEGDLVVTQGNFQIDSAVQIQAKPSMMNPEILIEAWVDRKVAAPETLKDQLGALVLAHAAFADAADHPEMEGHERALADFLAALMAIEHDALPADAHAFWSELAMKMANDATAAWELSDSVDRTVAAALLAERVALLQSVFGLNAGRQAPAEVTEIPALLPVFEAYLELQSTLAGDDEPGSRARAGDLRKAVDDASGLPAAWTGHRDRIAAALDGLPAEAPLETIREAFQEVSNALIAVARDVGMPPLDALYIAHCPMAGNDAGADWMQRDQDILNPYYGSGMLTCGYVTDTLAATPAAGGGHDHE